MTSISAQEFPEKVIDRKGVSIIDFWSPTCVPCKLLMPVLDSIAQEHPEVSVFKVNIEEEPNLAVSHMVTGLPSLIFYKDGAIREQLMGMQSKESIIGKLEKLTA